MATSGTGAIATFDDMAKITGVTISGTYDANQCIKYSDVSVTYSYPYTLVITLTRNYTNNSPLIYVTGPFFGKLATEYNTAPIDGGDFLATWTTGSSTIKLTLWSTLGSAPLIFSISGYSSQSIYINGSGSYSTSVSYTG